jgi:tRNA pseudouridine55 synthase
VDGVIVVDKPAGWTSHDVVGRMRRIARTKRVGHLGTLDPMATGVLPLVLNQATRLAQFYTGADKTYEGTVHFGYATNSYDADGEPAGEVRAVTPDPVALAAALERFKGEIDQTPPAVSAKKINGVPAYKLARANEPVLLKPVRVTIHALDVLGCDGPSVRLRVHCSSGTYIRSIAHDLGQALGCGAHLKALRRTTAGEFRIEQGHTLEQLEALAGTDRLAEALIPSGQLLPDFPTERIDDLTAVQIRNGRAFRTSPFRTAGTARYVKAVTHGGALVAIGEIRLPHLYHPVLVIPLES